MMGCFVQIVTAVVLGFMYFVGVRSEVSVQESLPLVNTYDQSPTAFSFRYPADWVYFIPEQGLLILGPATTDQNEIVPTVTILRTQRLSNQVATLEEAMSTYLRRGPLLPGQSWMIVAEVSATTLDDREALVVELEGANRADDPQQRVLAIITQADNGIFYIFAVGASRDEWETHLPTLRSILASVEILE